MFIMWRLAGPKEPKLGDLMQSYETLVMNTKIECHPIMAWSHLERQLSLLWARNIKTLRYGMGCRIAYQIKSNWDNLEETAGIKIWDMREWTYRTILVWYISQIQIWYIVAGWAVPYCPTGGINDIHKTPSRYSVTSVGTTTRPKLFSYLDSSEM